MPAVGRDTNSGENRSKTQYLSRKYPERPSVAVLGNGATWIYSGVRWSIDAPKTRGRKVVWPAAVFENSQAWETDPRDVGCGRGWLQSLGGSRSLDGNWQRRRLQLSHDQLASHRPGSLGFWGELRLSFILPNRCFEFWLTSSRASPDNCRGICVLSDFKVEQFCDLPVQSSLIKQVGL